MNTNAALTMAILALRRERVKARQRITPDAYPDQAARDRQTEEIADLNAAVALLEMLRRENTRNGYAEMTWP